MSKPFQRAWRVQRDPDSYATEEAHSLALALAATCDPEFLESLLHAKSALDRFGGELFIGTDRRKFNSSGEEITGGIGDFETIGYAFHWNSRTQVGRVEEAAPEVVEEVVEPEPELVGANDS